MVAEIIKTAAPEDFITDVLSESGYSDFKVKKTELTAIIYNKKDGTNYTTLRFTTTFAGDSSTGFADMTCNAFVDNLTGEWLGEY